MTQLDHVTHYPLENKDDWLLGIQYLDEIVLRRV